jgi:hypothetical protein
MAAPICPGKVLVSIVLAFSTFYGEDVLLSRDRHLLGREPAKAREI